MIVFVEYVLLDNFIIDYMLLNLVCKLNNIEVKKINLLLSASLGAVVALLSPIISASYLVFIKILTSFIMIYILNKASFKKYLTNLISFYILTVCFGGACYGFVNFFNINFIKAIDGQIVYNFPVGLAIIICYITYKVLKSFISKLFIQKRINNFCYDIKLHEGSNSIKCKGFLDSGNLTKDDDNCGIIYIDYVVFSKLFPEIPLENILIKKDIKLNNVKYITTHSVNTKQRILTFKIDRIEIYSNNILNIYNITCGLSLKPLFKNLGCNCILSPLLFKGEQ